MKIQFIHIPFSECEDDLRQYLISLPSFMDDYFVENHLWESHHYRIIINNTPAGLTAIHKESLITHFSLNTPFRRESQAIYSQVKKLEQVQAALVPTCDAFHLAHALDEYREIKKQAYIFAQNPDVSLPPLAENIQLCLAQSHQFDLVRETIGDFVSDLAYIQGFIEKQQLFLTLRQEQCVGYGIRVPGKICPFVASIGMLTKAEFRQQGVGSTTLRLLIEKCQQEGLHPVAGCSYYNHLSKKTLEKAGMFSQTRLLRIEF